MLRNKIIKLSILLFFFFGFLLFTGQKEVLAQTCTGSATFDQEGVDCLWDPAYEDYSCVDNDWTQSGSCGWDWPGYGTPGSTWDCGLWGLQYIACDCFGLPDSCTESCLSEFVWKTSGCSISGPTPTPPPPTQPPPTPTPIPPDTTPPTCSISGPTSVNIDTDATYIATGSDPEGNLTEVEIYKSPTENRSWTNIVDGCAGPVCQETTQFSSVGTYYVVCNAYDSAGNKCSGNPWCQEFPPVATPEIDCPGWSDCTTSDLLTVTVTVPGPWWQVQDADVITNGNLISPIPLTCVLPVCNPYFDLKGQGGYPGVPSYFGSASFGEGGVSEDPFGWLANSMTTLNKVYDYSYFQSMVRSNVEINEIVEPEIQGGYLINQGTQSRGYVWFKRQGDLTITGVANLQSRKVVLLVDGDLYLGRPPAQSGSNIRVQDGTGFFMAIVSGDIIISPKAEIDPLNPQPVFEGIFLAEGQVKTGTDGPGLDGQLWIRGSVAAYGGIVLERDLTDNGLTPAEFFEYGPDLLFTFPRDLTSRKYKWKEIAP